MNFSRGNNKFSITFRNFLLIFLTWNLTTVELDRDRRIIFVDMQNKTLAPPVWCLRFREVLLFGCAIISLSAKIVCSLFCAKLCFFTKYRLTSGFQIVTFNKLARHIIIKVLYVIMLIGIMYKISTVCEPVYNLVKTYWGRSSSGYMRIADVCLRILISNYFNLYLIRCKHVCKLYYYLRIIQR